MAENSANSLRLEVLAEISRIAATHNKKFAGFTDELAPLKPGSDSPGIAAVVAGLGQNLQPNRAATYKAAEFPVTLGDFIKLYENAAG